MKDTLFSSFLLEAPDDEAGFKETIRSNTALINWAEHNSDENIAYFLRLNKQHVRQSA